MRILVTGGAGFIGSHLAPRLAADGHEVRILDALTPQIHGPGADFSLALRAVAECRRGDVMCAGDVEAALEGCDAVVHLAAETGMGQSQYEIVRYTDVNVGGTARLLQAMADRHGRIRRLVLSSTARVYGDGPYTCPEHGRIFPAQRPVAQMARGDWAMRCPACAREVEVAACREDDPRQPGSMYAVTKAAQEDMVRLFGAVYGVETVILRYQNVYGAGQALRNPYTGVLSVFCTRLRNGLPPEIYEDGAESRDFVHVTDVAEATAAAVACPGAAGRTFNVGGGGRTSILDVARAIAAAFGEGPAPVITGMFRAGEVRHMEADLGPAREILGYSPRTPLAAGIRSLVAWVQGQPVQEDRSAQAFRELRERGLSVDREA
ncbi:MAG: NAD-dependent epimerase/dehydratase family protein [Deltaproteobacteria bacterium]|nr:NAD-dependent epimerase/dehydratase family protein [Deltaproteobacteria bacterium]